MNIFDAFDNDIEKFLAAAEEAFPGFQKKMCKKRKDDVEAKLEKEEKSLDAEIAKQEECLEDLKAHYEMFLAEKARAEKSFVNDINGAEDALDVLKEKKKEVHEKLVALNLSYPIVKNSRAFESKKEKVVEKPDLHKAFEIFIHQYDKCFKPTKKEAKKMFKRFDNLCQARCATTWFFGYHWTMSHVAYFIDQAGYSDLAKQLEDFCSHRENCIIAAK